LFDCQIPGQGFNYAMRHSYQWLALAMALLSSCLVSYIAHGQTGPVGIFDGHCDVGMTRHAGSVEFDAARRAYTVAGGGENMWFASDAFHFVWKRVSGDVTLAADIAFLGASGHPHRKACLIVRQSLDPDSAYADAALHGDGLASLQYRDAKGAQTYEIQSNVSAPKRLRIEKRGNYVVMSIAREGEELRPAGGSFRLNLVEPFYGICQLPIRSVIDR
jgi:hypothetical protein